MTDNTEEKANEEHSGADEPVVSVPAAEDAAEVESGESAPAEAEPRAEVKVVDKRRFARLLGFGFGSGSESGAEASDEAKPANRLPGYVAELKERAERAQAEARAEVEAARTRLERHYEARLASARAELVAGMLDVLDNFDRALAVPGATESPIYEGLAATRDMFLKRLGELGAEQIPSIGETFDPEIHEAVDEEEVDDPSLDGTIVTELQRGFRFGDRLVRPAVVRVARLTVPATGSES